MLVSTTFSTSLRISDNVSLGSPSLLLPLTLSRAPSASPTPHRLPYIFFLIITFQVQVVGLMDSCV